MFRSMFSKAVELVVPTRPLTLQHLIDQESKIGGQLFGQAGRGIERRFFMDEQNSWYYHETAKDSNGQKLYGYTIRYEIMSHGVLKSVDGKNHVFITGIELDRLKLAVKLYEERIMAELYVSNPIETSLVAHA